MEQFYQERPLLPSDLPFIFKNWLNVHHKQYPNCLRPFQLYQQAQRPIIQQLLDNAKTDIVCHIDDPDTIIGFINYHYFNDYLILNWMHIKSLYRKQGIAKQLLDNRLKQSKSPLIICTHSNSLLHKQYLHQAYPKLFRASFTNYKLTFDPERLI